MNEAKDIEPPSKKRKLSLSEAASLLRASSDRGWPCKLISHGRSSHGQSTRAAAGTSYDLRSRQSGRKGVNNIEGGPRQRVGEVSDDGGGGSGEGKLSLDMFAGEMEDELTQIESSMPHYLSCLFTKGSLRNGARDDSTASNTSTDKSTTESPVTGTSKPLSRLLEPQASPPLFDDSPLLTAKSEVEAAAGCSSADCCGGAPRLLTANTSSHVKDNHRVEASGGPQQVASLGVSGVEASSLKGKDSPRCDGVEQTPLHPAPRERGGGGGREGGGIGRAGGGIGTARGGRGGGGRGGGSRGGRGRAGGGRGGEYACPPSCVSLCVCSEASGDGRTVSLFVAVLQVNPQMEITCRKGTMAGQTVPIASLLLGDPTRAYFKLTLWREAACWVERLRAGDIVHFTNIRLKVWQREVVGHTTMRSTVLNLHMPKSDLPQRVCATIPTESLESMKEWVLRRHAYLFSSPAIHYKASVDCFTSSEFALSSAGSGTLVHFRALLLAMLSGRVVLVADDPEREVSLYLLSGDAGTWHRQLSGGVGAVWEFLHLRLALEATQGSCSLQTTSRSRLRCLDSDSEEAGRILRKFPSTKKAFSIKACSVREMLTSKNSGVYCCRARATSISFVEEGGTNHPVLPSTLASLNGLNTVQSLCRYVYVGCEVCGSQLRQDDNGVYCQCSTCLSQRPGVCASSHYYFRPLAVSLQDESGCVEVTALHAVVKKLLDVSARELFKAMLAEDNSKCEEIKACVMRFLDSSHCDGGSEWTLHCCFAKDDYSFVESCGFCLLDWTGTAVTNE